MCKTTPWFTEEDNLCFRQGKAASARGVVFPSLLFTARGRFLLWSAWLLCPSYTSAHWSVGRQTASSCAHSQAFSTSFSAFPVLSLSHSGLCSCFPYTVSDSTCLYPCLHLTPRFFFFFSPKLALSLAISPFVRGLMWDCKWSSLTSISGYQGSICVAHYQAGHSLPLRCSHEGGWPSKWNALNSSHANIAQRAT